MINVVDPIRAGAPKHFEDPGALKSELLACVLEHENGFSDRPLGGAPRWGLSRRHLVERRPDLLGVMDRLGFSGRHDICARGVAATASHDAAELYDLRLWQPWPWGQFKKGLALKLFDLAAFMGPETPVRLLQRVLRAFDKPVDETGLLDPTTASLVRNLESDFGNLAIILALKSEAAGLWRALLAHDPSLADYEAGWIRRSYF